MSSGPLDLHKTDIATFLSLLNQVHSLGLTDQQLTHSTKQLHDQWFNNAAELKFVDQQAFQFLDLPKQLATAIHSTFTNGQAANLNSVQLVANPQLAKSASNNAINQTLNKSNTTNNNIYGTMTGMETDGSRSSTLGPLPNLIQKQNSNSSDEKRSSIIVPNNNNLHRRPSSLSAHGGPIVNSSGEAEHEDLGNEQLASGDSDEEFQITADMLEGGSRSNSVSGNNSDNDEKNPNHVKKASSGHSLVALKKAVEHVCSTSVTDEKVLQNLQNILRQAMARSGKVTQSVLKEELKKLQQVATANSISKTAGATDFTAQFAKMNLQEEKKAPINGNTSNYLNGASSPLSASSTSPNPNSSIVCSLCNGHKDKKFELECKHIFDTSCIRDYINSYVGRQQAVGIKCPMPNCKELSTANIQSLLLPEEFESYLQATLMSFIESDGLTCICPNDKCRSVISVEPPGNLIPPNPMTEKDDDGKPLSVDAWKHFQEFRVRCRECNLAFCAQCKVAPYHKGYTCQQFKEYQSARHCRFCLSKLDDDNKWINDLGPALRDVCTEDECKEKAEMSCDKMLSCGCPCGGIKGEKECLPCLKHELECEEEFCPICYVEALGVAPAIKMTGPCTHVMHLGCVKTKLETKWPGARVGFEFRQCPLCKQNMHHPSLEPILKPILELESSITEKALARLKFEGRDKDPAIINKNGEYYNNPMGFAMKQYLFYMCFKCQKPYFAGGYQCQEANAAFDPAELICPGCQPHSVEDCGVHGKDWLAYKCRYCCSFANWYCWGNCHFCLASNTPVRQALNNGQFQIVTIDTLKLGEFMLNEKNQPVQITQVSQGKSKLYTVRQQLKLSDSDSSFQATPDHILCLISDHFQPIQSSPTDSNTRILNFCDTNYILHHISKPIQSGNIDATDNALKAEFAKIKLTQIYRGRKCIPLLKGEKIEIRIQELLALSNQVRNGFKQYHAPDLQSQSANNSKSSVIPSTYSTEMETVCIEVIQKAREFVDNLNALPQSELFTRFDLQQPALLENYLTVFENKQWRTIQLDDCCDILIVLLHIDPQIQHNLAQLLESCSFIGSRVVVASLIPFSSPFHSNLPALNEIISLNYQLFQVMKPKFILSCGSFVSIQLNQYSSLQTSESIYGLNQELRQLNFNSAQVHSFSSLPVPNSIYALEELYIALRVAGQTLFPLDYSFSGEIPEQFSLSIAQVYSESSIKPCFVDESPSEELLDFTAITVDGGKFQLGTGIVTHNCDKCHKSGVWQQLAIFRTGKNKKKLWEYDNCPSLKPQVEAIGRDNSLNEEQKNDKIGKLLSAKGGCALGIRHPPTGIEFGLGCSMCEDSTSSADKLKEELGKVREKLLVVKNEIVKSGPKQFNYQQDFDQNGLMYYLGTCGKTQPWTNPAEAGFVRVTSSGLMGDSAPLSAAVGREVVRCVTTPVRNSWFQFELIDFAMSLSAYTLRHYNSWDTECLRNWELAGSNDNGATWETLSIHVNDQALNKKGAAATWPVESRGRKYKLFRILQNGRNSNNNFYLPCSGIEFYGTLYIAEQGASNGSAVAAVSAKPSLGLVADHPSANPFQAQQLPVAAGPFKSFVFHHDFDQNGIIWHLGTRFGQNKQWVNPCELGLVRVTCSELASQPASTPASAAIGREVVRCVTASKPNQWFCIDFTSSGKRIRPAAYTLRHYNSWDLEALRNWRFEGSVNGIDWFVLSVHVNDCALDKKGASHTWALPNCQGVFSIFRIWQTGFNSNNHHYLALSGFEIYGDLIDLTQQPQQVVQPAIQYQSQIPVQQAYQSAIPQQLPPNPYASAYLPQQQQPPMQAQPSAALVGIPVNPSDPNLITFRYQFDFDTYGLFYYLGTQFRRNPVWQNPADLGFVTCTASSLAVNPPSTSANAIVGREVVRCVTIPKPDQWFIIDLKDKYFCPTHYTLRHYNSWDTEALRFWKLEGSIDGLNWDCLRMHMNDKALNKKGETHTWPISSPGFRMYRMFRIYQTGPNSNNNNYLALSGVEMYGMLSLKPPQALSNPSANNAPVIAPQQQQQQQLQRQSLINNAPPPYQSVAGSFSAAQPPPYQSVALQQQRGSLSIPPPLPVRAPDNLNQPVYQTPQPPISVQHNPNNPFLTPSISNKLYQEFKEGMEFIYHHDFDENGILYWLGTNQYRQPWRNPGETGQVIVQSVPLAIQPKSEPCTAIVGRSIVRCVTLPNRESWFSIDFQRWWIKPTHYTLRHYDSWDTECLRDWKLQASNDGKKWTKLISHKKDETLNSKGASGTWAIPAVKKGYRMFRVLQTGKNSNGHWYMACSGFEIYGKVYSFKC